MGFRPLGDRHAIQEVVFILNFARPIDGQEMDRFFESHERWKADLPKAERPQFIQLFIGAGVPNRIPPPVPPTAIAPAVFQSFRRDGTLEWQMQANQNWLAVNCLSYTRWDAVSKQACGLLTRALDSFQSDNLPIVATTLQYIDTFLWEGDLSKYDCGQLLNRNSKLLPKEFSPYGPAWHFHSGAFDLGEGAETGRRLMRRVHIDSQIEGETSTTRMDISLTSDFLDGAGGLKSMSFADSSTELESLHIDNKNILSEIISSDMQNRIALFGD